MSDASQTDSPCTRCQCSMCTAVGRLLVAFAIAVLLLCIVYYVVYQSTRPSATPAAVANLQKGMTAAQIQQHIGPPNARQIIDDLETWWYYDPDNAQHALEPRDIANLVITFDHDNKLYELKFMER